MRGGLRSPSPANSRNSPYTSARAARSMPRVGSSRSRTFGDENRQRASSAFCWIATTERLDRHFGRRRAYTRARHERAGGVAFSFSIDPPPTTHTPERRQRRVGVHTQLRKDAVTLAFFGKNDESRAACLGWSRWGILVSIEPDAAAHLATVRSDERGRKSVRPAPTSPARPTTSPARTESDTSRSVAPASSLRRSTERCSTRSSSRALGGTAVTLLGGMSRPTMSLTRSRAVRLRRGERRNLLAVSHHRDAIGEAQHLVELMRDVDDARSRGNERTNHVLQARFLGDT